MLTNGFLQRFSRKKDQVTSTNPCCPAAFFLQKKAVRKHGLALVTLSFLEKKKKLCKLLENGQSRKLNIISGFGRFQDTDKKN